MATTADGSGRAWRVRAAAVLVAASVAGSGAPAAAGDLHSLPGLDSAVQAEIRQVVALAIAQPAASQVPYLGTVPLGVQVLSGPAPARVFFALERMEANGWQALGTYETGWNTMPPLIPGSFLQASGRYRIRVAPDSNARRVVTPVERDWSAWREFTFKAGNSVPVGGGSAPGVLMPGDVRQR